MDTIYLTNFLSHKLEEMCDGIMDRIRVSHGISATSGICYIQIHIHTCIYIYMLYTNTHTYMYIYIHKNTL